MRKQEFIHLHALLAEVTTDFQDCGRSIELEAYREQGVRPTSIHKSKTAHKEAVMTLAGELVENLEADNRTVRTTAD
ncbi:MAG TPA: UPF0058 family protein [Natrialbaceae archaeon]|nr:UPF0058 family protein [Natrialbaceae archaeon]